MRILLDTNIIIPLEDSSKTLGESFSELVRLANANNHKLIVHPASLEDIQRDSDAQRKAISLSRVRKYPFLENPPIPDVSELKRLELKQDDENDRVDNQILYSIYKDAANILITEDRGLHRKAAQLGLDDRVYYIQQATESLRRLHTTVPVSLPNIEELSLHQLDLRNTFFDSLRSDVNSGHQVFHAASCSV